MIMNKPYHTIKYFFALAFLFSFLCSGAQDTITIHATQSDTVHYFDTISPASVAPVVQRKVSDSAINRLRKDDAFWYANQSPEKEKQQEFAFPWWWNLARKKWFK